MVKGFYKRETLDETTLVDPTLERLSLKTLSKALESASAFDILDTEL